MVYVDMDGAIYRMRNSEFKRMMRDAARHELQPCDYFAQYAVKVYQMEYVPTLVLDHMDDNDECEEAIQEFC